MFVFKHAFLNLKRNTWNYILVGIILFLLILSSMVTNTMYTSAKLFAKNYSKQFTMLVTILESGLSNLTHEEKLTKEQYLKFGESAYVNNIQMTASVPVSFETLKTVATASPVRRVEDDVLTQTSYQTAANWFGAGATELTKHLSESGMEISAGSTNLKRNECLISEALAQMNQLKIGDSIQVTVTGNEQVEKQTLVIAGMYRPKKQTQSNGASEWMNIQENDVFTNWETLHAIKNFNRFGYSSVSYELKKTDDFDAFLKEIQAKGLPSEYQVMTNEANMQMLLSPVNGLGTLAGTILLGLLLFGNFSVALFSIRTFKQKQTEICVMRNIGITQKQLISSRLIELIVVTVFSFSFALLIAKWIVQPIADWQLKNQKLVMGNVDQLFSVMGSGETKAITSIPMVINNDAILMMIGIACFFLITIISVESYKIFKFEPIDFLLERNINE
ncbi:ABC transporter permease [Enterococcus crotali]|uniref:ABC transporter permease n=1 Tax=Enterococcus crotali TaxID=1453587 RepID=UPI000471FA8C|nr:ABC transporter permease [Enterococcus crotali]